MRTKYKLIVVFLFLGSLYFSQKNNSETSKYVSFLEKQNTTAKDYVINLFKTFDVVILCERNHPEMTQYDLIYDIINTKYFKNNVGNIFTEIGSYSNRKNTLNFIKTKFKNDRLRELKQAEVYRNGFFPPMWYNTNFFNFTGRLNLLNSKLNRNKKVNLFTSGTANPSLEERSTEDGMKKYVKENYLQRDSLMAENIIKTFDSLKIVSKRKKALVIMNYRHAFNKNYFKQGNVGAFLFKRYNGKIANVYINGLASTNKTDEKDKAKAKIFQGMEQVPIQYGKWDASFKIAKKENLGFNFKDSPFGNDNFDIWSASKSNDKYEDVFTGFIYYLPLEKHVVSKGVNNFLVNTDIEKIINEWNLFNEVLGSKEKRKFSPELRDALIKETSTIKSQQYPNIERYKEIINKWLE